MVLDHCLSLPTTSSFDINGYARLRERIHRRRHKHRHVPNEAANDLFENFVHDMQTRRHAAKESKRESNEDLCKSERTSVELNTDAEEFDPPFIVHIRCKDNRHSTREQVHVSRRIIGTNHWYPHTLMDVPLGCDCMWPVDKYGHQEL
ncbi:hypothetical protein WR25_22414 [Diploscapter pachys]|uniref:Uncharacterized protein n=1 Tax=Diploscapter pachys TaxID=2018661 RepID=A0A2A2JJ85_9BILA|nr:hypothetical protein WR25_22414 [Diploscapter pachys]